MGTDRVRRLKARLFETDDRVLFVERMEIIQRCALEYAGESAGVRFGHTLRDLLSNISIVIEEDDLILGRVREVVPTEEQERWFEENHQDRVHVPWFQTDGHLTLSWPRLLDEGLCGIRQRAQTGLASLQSSDAFARSKADFWQGTILCCDAIEAYALRHAERAETLARAATTGERRRELLDLARICRRVPAYPARTLHEAVQSIWLVDLVLHAVVGARDFALGRLDQYLYPFYQRDLVAGRITAERAQELIECLYIKCSEIIGYGDQANRETRKRSLCQDSVQYVVLGGQTPDGRNAVNPLSTICLKAGYLQLKQPTIVVRYFEGIDAPASGAPGAGALFWREACRLIRAGGSVGVYNDDVVIPAFTSVGVEPRDARDYVHYGCCNANVPGKEGSLMERWHNLPKFLELALNDGCDPLTGQQVGPQRGDVDRFASVDDLLEALKVQVRHALEIERAAHPPLSDADRARCSFTLESIFLEDCIENGREWRLGGAKYKHKSQHGVGIATVADSLAAIQEVVFESHGLSLAELRDILNADFRGHEPLRQRLIHRCHKYGNDADAVDALAVRVAEMFCDEVVRCNNIPGCNEVQHDIRFWPEVYSYHNNRHLGAQVGATADGRKRGESISENQSPVYGTDLNGVTACLRSIAKLPTHRTPGGGTNLRLHPSAVQGEAGLEALSSLLKTYFALGGQHLQLNILDGAVLRRAQQHPEEYRTLSVRVVGYSAYFCALTQEVQDAIIRRTEHTLQRETCGSSVVL
jgi:pyruvate formate-lyase/glycerol dehydratase family glycyl radical enzyme